MTLNYNISAKQGKPRWERPGSHVPALLTGDSYAVSLDVAPEPGMEAFPPPPPTTVPTHLTTPEPAAMKTFSHVLPSMLACIFLQTVALAQEESVKPGINDAYNKTTVEKKVAQFERADRDVVQKKNEIIDACRLKPGMHIADVGAGTGLFTRLFAASVGCKGKVYAVDITRKFIEHIEKTCSEQDIKNVTCVVCTPNSTELKPGSVDLVFTCDTYHHFEYPQKVLASIHQALRPGGRLIIIDMKKKITEASNGMKGHIRADKETVIKEVTKAHFKLIDELPLMEKQYVLRFEKKKE
jgi:ubiquinone/menaquinone biosynthesis C-methylase UbiE